MTKNLVRAVAVTITAGLLLTPTAATADEAEPASLNPLSLTAVCDDGEAFLEYVIEPHPDAETTISSATWKYSYQGTPVGQAHGIFDVPFTGRLPWHTLAEEGDGWVMREYGILVDDIDLYFSARTLHGEDELARITVTVDEAELENPCGPPAPLDVVVAPVLPAGVEYPVTACGAGPEDVQLPVDTEAIGYSLVGGSIVATVNPGYTFGWFGQIGNPAPWTVTATAGNYFGYYDAVTEMGALALDPQCEDGATGPDTAAPVAAPVASPVAAPVAAGAAPVAAPATAPVAAVVAPVKVLAYTGPTTVAVVSALAGVLVAAGVAILLVRRRLLRQG